MCAINTGVCRGLLFVASFLSRSAMLERDLGIGAALCLSVCQSQAGTKRRQMLTTSRGFHQ